MKTKILKHYLLLFFILFSLTIPFNSCSDDDVENIDTTPPIIFIIEPENNSTFSTDTGVGRGYEMVTMFAKAVDETGMSFMKETVRNSGGEEVSMSSLQLTGTQSKTMQIWSQYGTPNEGTYTVTFEAVDTSGNTKYSESRTFTFEN